MTTDEHEEFRRLCRDSKTLHEEREIAQETRARFAKETGSIPPKDASL